MSALSVDGGGGGGGGHHHISSRSALPDLNDPQTVADIRSQKRIIGSLKAAFPGLTVVGEEGNLSIDTKIDVVNPRFDMCEPTLKMEGKIFPSSMRAIPISEVVCWIDPLDGTKEFTKGLVEAVTVLIGISVSGVATGGVIHVPFVKPPRTVWGAVNVGAFGREDHTSDTLPPFVSPLATSASFISNSPYHSATNAPLLRPAPSLSHSTKHGVKGHRSVSASAEHAPYSSAPTTSTTTTTTAVNNSNIADNNADDEETQRATKKAKTYDTKSDQTGASVALTPPVISPAGLTVASTAVSTADKSDKANGSVASERRWAVTSSSHLTAEMVGLINGMGVQRTINVGGAGNKGLMVIDGKADAYMYVTVLAHPPSTMSS